MTNIEKKLITDFALELITRDEFLQRYPVDLRVQPKYILNSLQQAYEEKGTDNIDYLILLGFLMDVFNSDYVDILRRLILQDWHHKHEDIALILQDLKNPATVDCLYEAAEKKFEYLDYNDTYALARKCIHALADINTEYSWEKLKLLAASDVSIIKEKAQKQLNRHKRQG